MRRSRHIDRGCCRLRSSYNSDHNKNPTKKGSAKPQLPVPVNTGEILRLALQPSPAVDGQPTLGERGFFKPLNGMGGPIDP